MNWFVELLMTGIRWLLLFIDVIVYGLVEFFYELFFAVSQIRLFAGGASGSESMIETVANRVYALIGIYALFKVVFILINTLINPDNMNDKQKSPGKIAVRLVGMLALIIAVPWCFDYAYRIQDAVVGENIISKIILGVDDDPGEGDSGEKISSIIFSGFVTIDERVLEDPNLEDPYVESNLKGGHCKKSTAAVKGLRDGDRKISSLYSYIGTTFASENDGDQFCIDYQIIISLIGGGFAAYIFAVYCLDMGLRVAKMAFYELIAPVPIVTFVDGKKDGAFNNWLKSVISTYADIFLRLIIINFVVFVIQHGVADLMNLEVLEKYNFVTRNFARIIIILGLLMFAAQAPKLIKGLFGIKDGDGGDYGMSLTKKLGSAAVVGGALSSGASNAGHAARAGASKGASTLKNRGVQLAANMRDKWNSGGDAKVYAAAKQRNADNFAVRQKAASVQALAMMDSKNWDSKSHKYTGIKANDLASQVLNQRDSGLKGRISSAQSQLTNRLSMMTPEPPSTVGMKKAKGLSINVGNMLSQQSEKINKLNQKHAAALQGLYSSDPNVKKQAQKDINQIEIELQWDSSKNWQNEAVSIFEVSFKNVGLTFDKDFINGVPDPNDEAAWSKYEAAMQDAVKNISTSPKYNEAQKEQLMKQAESFAAKLSEQQKKAVASGKK